MAAGVGVFSALQHYTPPPPHVYACGGVGCAPRGVLLGCAWGVGVWSCVQLVFVEDVFLNDSGGVHLI